MFRLITLMMIVSSCYAQHPYIDLNARQLVKQAQRDGYEVESQYCDNIITFTLHCESDTITVEYSIYRSKPLFVRYEE